MDEYIYWFKLVILLLINCDGLKEIFKKNILKVEKNKIIKSFLFLLKKCDDYDNVNKYLNNNLLFEYIKIFHKDFLYKITKKAINFKYIIEYINILFLIDILKTFKISFKDLYYYDNSLYKLILSNREDIYTDLRLETDIDPYPYTTEHPEILILFNEELFKIFNEIPIYYSNEQEEYITLKESVLQEKITISSTTGIPTYEKIINYNGVNYKLEACFLDNLIMGLTINNDNYIYDGCNKYIYDWKTALYTSQESFNMRKKDCKLHKIFKYENLNINFGYDINTGTRNSYIILIYVKINEKEEQEEQEEIDSKSLKNSSKTMKEYVKDYYQLKYKSFDELKQLLLEIGYNFLDISQFTRENILTKLEDKYKKLFKISHLTDEITFVKRLIKDYLKNKKIYSFIDLFKLDDIIIKEIDSVALLKFNKEDLIKLYSYIYSTTTIDKTKNNKFFIDKIKEKLFKLSSCSNLEVIPQVSGTCWFNAMLMALLYSQETRKITYELSLEWTKEEIKKDKMKKFFKYMLKYNYTEPEKITKLFESKTKPELLLMEFLIQNKQQIVIDYIKEQLNKDIDNYGYLINYFSILLSLYNYKFLSLYYIYGNVYKNILNEKLRINETNEIPEILLLYHEDLNSLIPEKNLISLNENEFKYDKETFGIENYEEIIEVNKINYKLDSCILINYNILQISNHAILGLTCGNENYVYNGWNNTKNKINYGYEYLKTINKACKLFKYDWKRNLYTENDGFCLNKKTCNLDEIDDDDLCFNFSKGDRVLIYVRIKGDESLEKKDESSLSNILYNSKSISPLIKEFYNLEEKEIEELKEILKQIGYDIDIIEELTNETIHLKYKLFYIYLFNKLFKKEDDILKKLLIKLIKDYIKYNKIYNLYEFKNNKQYLELFLSKIEENKLLNIYKLVIKDDKIPDNLKNKKEIIIHNIIKNSEGIITG